MQWVYIGITPDAVIVKRCPLVHNYDQSSYLACPSGYQICYKYQFPFAFKTLLPAK